jgi:hypothetical protein
MGDGAPPIGKPVTTWRLSAHHEVPEFKRATITMRELCRMIRIICLFQRRG